MNLTIEQMWEIVNDAPKWASHYVPSTGKTICCHNEDHFYFRDQEKLGVEHIRLNELRAALADHDRTDYVSDIRNHISPTTVMIER